MHEIKKLTGGARPVSETRRKEFLFLLLLSSLSKTYANYHVP